jgi:hypothetical protein
VGLSEGIERLCPCRQRLGAELLLEHLERRSAFTVAGRHHARAFDIDSTVAISLALFSYQAGRIRPRGQPAASQVLVYEIGRLPGRAQVYCHFFPEFWQFSVVI